MRQGVRAIFQLRKSVFTTEHTEITKKILITISYLCELCELCALCG